MSKPIFEGCFRGKYAVDSESVHSLLDLANQLEAAAARLKKMHAAGICLDPEREDEGQDDYWHYVTTDPEAALQFSMNRVDVDSE